MCQKAGGKRGSASGIDIQHAISCNAARARCPHVLYERLSRPKPTSWFKVSTNQNSKHTKSNSIFAKFFERICSKLANCAILTFSK